MPLSRCFQGVGTDSDDSDSDVDDEWVSYSIIVHVLLLSGDGILDRPWAVGDFIFSFIGRLLAALVKYKYDR